MLFFLEKKERKKNTAVTASCIALKNVFDTAGSLQQGTDEQSISMHALFSGFSQYHTFVGANIAYTDCHQFQVVDDFAANLDIATARCCAAGLAAQLAASNVPAVFVSMRSCRYKHVLAFAAQYRHAYVLMYNIPGMLFLFFVFFCLFVFLLLLGLFIYIYIYIYIIYILFFLGGWFAPTHHASLLSTPNDIDIA